jgi:mRNA interferase MazF
MVMARRYVPERGDFVWLQFSPQAGHEQAGLRPALVVSSTIYNEKTGLALFCPITNQIKGYPFEVVISPGLKVTGAVLSDHIKCLDWKARNAKKIVAAPKAVVDVVIAKIASLLEE